MAEEAGETLAETVIRREVHNTGADPEAIRARIGDTLDVMRSAIAGGLDSDERSPTGMTGGRARRLLERDDPLLDPTFSLMLARAIATLEVNARMGLIVAAPTAGAAGILPGVLLTLAEARWRVPGAAARPRRAARRRWRRRRSPGPRAEAPNR